MSGILYGVLGAFIWGFYAFVIKRYFSDYPSSVFAVVINVFAILWYLPIAYFTWPSGTAFLPPKFGVNDGLFVVGVLIVNGAAFLSFLKAINSGEVSYVAPISKIVPAFVLPLEIIFLNQKLGFVEMFGVFVITSAVYIANYEPGKLLDPFVRALSYRPAQLALLSAALYGVFDVSKRVILQDISMEPQTWVLVSVGGLIIVLLPLAYRDWPQKPIRNDLPKFALAGTLVGVGVHITALAFTLLPASIASPIVNAQAVVTVLLGGIILREKDLVLRIGAALLAVTGIFLITSGDKLLTFI